MDPLCLCYKVSNLLCFINPFTLQRAEINVEKFNNAPFRAIMSSKQLVEYTVLDVSYNPQRGAEGAGQASLPAGGSDGVPLGPHRRGRRDRGDQHAPGRAAARG